MLIPENYISSLCEIKTMENQLISRGKIKEIEADSIKVADRDGNMELISFGTRVKINIFNNKSGFRVLVGKVLTSNEEEMKIVDIMSLVDHERREFFRVSLKNHTNMYIANTLVEAQLSEPIKIVVNDLSLSGLQIETKKELQTNQDIWVEFDIKGKLYLWQCKVIRMVEYNELGVYYYGCQFAFDDSNENDILCAYLFQKQREQIQQKAVY